MRVTCSGGPPGGACAKSDPVIGQVAERERPQPTPLGRFASLDTLHLDHARVTVRGLLMGTPIGNGGVLAAPWCVGIGLVGYLSAKRLVNRDPSLG